MTWSIAACERHHPENDCVRLLREDGSLVTAHIDRQDAVTLGAVLPSAPKMGTEDRLDNVNLELDAAGQIACNTSANMGDLRRAIGHVIVAVRLLAEAIEPGQAGH